MSKNEKAKQFVEEILDDITLSRLPLSAIMKKYLRVTQLLDMPSEQVLIVDKELNGYNTGDIIPPYRKINCSKRYSWFGSLPSWTVNYKATHDQFYKQRFQDYLLYESLAKLEIYQGKGMAYNLGEQLVSNVTVTDILDVRPEQIAEVLQIISNKLFYDCSRLSIYLEFSGQSNTIFQEKEKFVTLLLEKVSPEAIKKLNIARDGLRDGKEPIQWSQVSLACIESLINFANDIYKEAFLPAGEKVPAHGDFKRKLKFTLKAITKNKERFDYIDKLLGFISGIDNYLQTNKHRSDLVKKSDADRCVIYTYLAIGDILEILADELKNVPQKVQKSKEA